MLCANFEFLVPSYWMRTRATQAKLLTTTVKSAPAACWKHVSHKCIIGPIIAKTKSKNVDCLVRVGQQGASIPPNLAMIHFPWFQISLCFQILLSP